MRLSARLRPEPLRDTGGPGPVRLVAVPGLGLSVHAWAATLSALAGPRTGPRGVVVALPAFGRPAGRGTALDPVSSARRLLDRLDALGTGPVTLLGHSASAQIVAEAARRAPARVAGLVLVGPTTDPDAAARLPLLGRWLRTVAHEHPGQVPMLLRDYAHSGPAGFVRALHAARRHRIDAVLADVGCRTLVVRGVHDRIAPAGWTERLAAATGDGAARTLPAGAHMVPVTHPAQLAAELRRHPGLTGGPRAGSPGDPATP